MKLWSASQEATGTERRAIIALCVVASAIVTWQRGRSGHWHSTLKIFRQSFWHLLAGTNLYARYPAEQGPLPASVFKYSPSAAVFFAPLAIMPYPLALLAWSLLNALLLCWALTRLLPGRRGTIATAMVFPELFASMQACSSNAVIAALIVLAFVFFEHRQQIQAALSIAVGAAMKIYPLAALVFAVFHPRRRRFAIVFVLVSLAILLLPLLFASPHSLIQQYRWWYEVEHNDARDLAFGDSVMRLARGWIGGAWPNWPVQVAGTILLLLPLAIRRERWNDAEFRLHFLGSLLAYAVLFNHQAERPSFVVGATGVVIWYVTPPGVSKPTWLRTVIAVLALVGLRTPPLLLAWVAIQLELFGWRLPWLARTVAQSGTNEPLAALDWSAARDTR